jgi:cytochrome c peroxidase
MIPHNVGTRGARDKSSSFDTPALIEAWRTSPFLHDGSAATLREVIVEKNKEDKHGKTSHLNEEQVDDLVAYLLSL